MQSPPKKRPNRQDREKGWDNYQTIGRKTTNTKKYGYCLHSLLKSVDLSMELQTLSGINKNIEKERIQYFSQPKPMPAYFSIAASLGLNHHEGTNVSKELEVVKRIIARESLLLKLENLCRKLVRWEALERSTAELENDLLLTLADMRNRSVDYLESLVEWRESAIDYDPHNPRIYFWENRNYTLKITTDLDFLADQPLFVDALKLPLEKIKKNPLMLPNTLEESDNWIEPTQRAAADAGGQTVGELYGKRLKVRLAERVLLMELELAVSQESEQQWESHVSATGAPQPPMPPNAQHHRDSLQMQQLRAKSAEFADYTEQERRDVAYLNWHLEAQLQKAAGAGDDEEDLSSLGTMPAEPPVKMRRKPPTPGAKFIPPDSPEEDFGRPTASAGGSRRTTRGQTDTPLSEVPTTGQSKGVTTAGTDPDLYAPIDDESSQHLLGRRSYTPYGIRADDEEEYDSDAFEAGDTTLDPFLRQEEEGTSADTGADPGAFVDADATVVLSQRPKREFHTGVVDFVEFESAEGAPDGPTHAALYEEYDIHALLDPVSASELTAIGALVHPPVRLRLAAAGIVIVLSRFEGEEVIPADVSFRAFQRLTRTSDFLAVTMNSVDPSTLSRVKVTALESYLSTLNVTDEFPDRHLSPRLVEIGNKVCKWVVLVVSAARAYMETQRARRVPNPPHGRQPTRRHTSNSQSASVMSSSNNSSSSSSKRHQPGKGHGSGNSHSHNHHLTPKLQPGQLPPKSMAQLPKLAQVAKPSVHAEKFKKTVKAGGIPLTGSSSGSSGGGGAGSVHVKGRVRGWVKLADQGAAKHPPVHPSRHTRQTWPVHSELIEASLHIHPVLLTLSSFVNDGVLSTHDGLLAKAYDLVDSQEAVTHIDIKDFNTYLQYLQQRHPPEAVYRVFQPLNVEWWAHALRHIVEITLDAGLCMMMQVSKSLLERYVLDQVYQPMAYDQQERGHDPRKDQGQGQGQGEGDVPMMFGERRGERGEDRSTTDADADKDMYGDAGAGAGAGAGAEVDGADQSGIYDDDDEQYGGDDDDELPDAPLSAPSASPVLFECETGDAVVSAARMDTEKADLQPISWELLGPSSDPNSDPDLLYGADPTLDHLDMNTVSAVPALTVLVTEGDPDHGRTDPESPESYDDYANADFEDDLTTPSHRTPREGNNVGDNENDQSQVPAQQAVEDAEEDAATAALVREMSTNLVAKWTLQGIDTQPGAGESVRETASNATENGSVVEANVAKIVVGQIVFAAMKKLT